MRNDKRLPDAELEVMQAIWSLGTQVTAAEVQQHADKDWKMTSVLTFLSRLCDKGFLSCTKEGRQNLYTPLVSEEDYAVMEDYTRRLFARGQEIAARHGLILVDTKYEFGKRDGKVYLIDEIHTPDSSRYFYADGYEEKFVKGEPQRQLSKEFVRQWLIEHGFMNEPGQTLPEITDAYAESVSERYIELYEHITGEKFDKAAEEGDIAARIERNVSQFLATRK